MCSSLIVISPGPGVVPPLGEGTGNDIGKDRLGEEGK